MPVVTGINTPPLLSDEAATKQHADSNVGAGVPTGTILMYGHTEPPAGYLLCNGDPISRTVYAALFTAIGTSYGSGNGSTTFNLPNLKAKFPIGRKVGGNTPTLGVSGGAFNHTHTATDHTHSMNSHTHNMAHEHSITHTHNYNHTHGLQDHRHTFDHAHTIYAHSHAINITTNIDDPSGVGQGHAHTIPTRSSTASGTSSLRGSSNTGVSSSYYISTGSTSHSHSVTSSSVGPNTAGDADFASGGTGSALLSSPSQSSTDSGSFVSLDAANAAATPANSANTNGLSVTITGGPSATNTTGAVSSGVTDSNNPPYLVVSYIIKV